MKTNRVQIKTKTSGKITNNQAVLLGLLLVSGCSSYQETFDCPAKGGVGCKAVSTVDALVEVGQLPVRETEEMGNKIRQPTQPKYIALGPISLHANEAIEQDTKLRIWLAGYEDEHGVYRSESYLHVAPDNSQKGQQPLEAGKK